jgi:hypothetical protein
LQYTSKTNGQALYMNVGQGLLCSSAMLLV